MQFVKVDWRILFYFVILINLNSDKSYWPEEIMIFRKYAGVKSKSQLAAAVVWQQDKWYSNTSPIWK